MYVFVLTLKDLPTCVDRFDTSKVVSSHLGLWSFLPVLVHSALHSRTKIPLQPLSACGDVDVKQHLPLYT